MRVIAGSARHLKLKTIEGMGTRPTTDRIKETLFNMLAFDIEGSTFLDLFSGSGGIGIEALSRGARHAVFVEQNRKALSCIRENLTHTHLSDKARVMGSDVMSALRVLSDEQESFDYIFMDPPYGKLLEKEAVLYLEQSSLCDSNTVIIVESDLSTDFSWVKETGFSITREKKYKTNKHTFLCRE
ncbi:MAG: 16S rRNA (guanine(966)-N(2))-methyltransferase RsmD [Anaerobutyricum sp.]|nr:16S rRNA (guanine(966)-N(2))-methyltransferase RsmD [Anaerobutyricum sp.]